MDLIDRIDRAALDYPERIAHVSQDRTLTYAQLAQQSDALARYFTERFPGDHSPVAVIGHKEPELLIAFLGAVKSGRAYVPIDASVPSRRAAGMVQASRAIATLTASQIVALTNGNGRSTARPHRIEPDDPFYIIFTSGSTGEPKGVVITLRCLTTFVDWMLESHAFMPGAETFLNQAPFSFDLSVMDLYPSLTSGGTLFSISRDEVANPKRLYAALGRSAVTTWVSTPTFAQICLVERTFTDRMLPQVRRFFFCGETLAPAIASQLLDRFPNAEVWNTYGPTEATVACAAVRIDRAVLARGAPLPVGVPMPGTEVLLTDASGQPVAAGERGEIMIAGPNVSPGYVGRPDLTAAAFFSWGDHRAYRTGDWGRMQDGLLFFEGRTDAQIKLNGYRIELGDVQENLRSLPGVADGVVLPVIKQGVPQSLAAFVVPATRGSENDFELATRLRAALAERLPSYMLPGRFIFVDAFPMTANGKTDRQKLAELLA
ncbi:MAG: D-alanine--poly(phosphoribitol) ligase subunit DltA [Verrucomicrobia bacterium]|nr:D-alanine--poly(phosphoribitol) ligase subunit DltA [Verrucomicrobiota bacterium]